MKYIKKLNELFDTAIDIEEQVTIKRYSKDLITYTYSPENFKKDEITFVFRKTPDAEYADYDVHTSKECWNLFFEARKTSTTLTNDNIPYEIGTAAHYILDIFLKAHPNTNQISFTYDADKPNKLSIYKNILNKFGFKVIKNIKNDDIFFVITHKES